MRIRRHAPQQEETGIDLAPKQRTLPVMNLRFQGTQSVSTCAVPSLVACKSRALSGQEN